MRQLGSYDAETRQRRQRAIGNVLLREATKARLLLWPAHMAARRSSGSSKKTRKTTRKTSNRKTSSSKTGRKTSARKTSSRKKSSRRYGAKASKKVGSSMHEMKEGTLRSGRSGRRVTNRKQAIAIGLSEARREGGKVPPAPRKKRSKKGGSSRGRKTGGRSSSRSSSAS